TQQQLRASEALFPEIAAWPHSSSCHDIKLEGEEADILQGREGPSDPCPIYYDGELVSGQVTIHVREGKRTTHDGIKV
ncbi:hypothetical protein EDB83DRAFT_2412389, partial [Lactarius deliciosus]